MRKLGVWSMAAIVVTLGLAASRASADEDEDLESPPKRNWVQRLFGPAPETTQPKVDADEVAARLEAAQAKARAERKQAEARQARGEYLRRQQVLDQLLEIAVLNNDSATEKKLRDLERRAWAVYLKKSGRQATDVESNGDSEATGRNEP